MVATDPLTPEQIERLRRSTGVAGKESELEQELLEERRRILRAKKELRRVVEGLGEDRSFNLIVYSTEVAKWQEMMVAADEKKRKSAVEFIEALEADGITVTDLALQEALADPKIDTIYLITDGAPTHVGLTGPGLPPDSKGLMERILAETKAMNHLRGVRIFTLGFEGAEEGFLEQLSGENGGRYVRIR
jgi:von Willebrand factor type A domain